MILIVVIAHSGKARLTGSGGTTSRVGVPSVIDLVMEFLKLLTRNAPLYIAALCQLGTLEMRRPRPLNESFFASAKGRIGSRSLQGFGVC